MADPDTARRAPVLDLSTLVERPQIAIDGERYEILSPDELSVLDLQRFTSMGRRLDELAALETPAPEEQHEMLGLITQLSDRIMVGVPEDVRAKLSAAHVMRVTRVFTGLLSAQATPAGAESAPGRSGKASTGAPRPRVSSASMAGTRAGGSPKRPRRSSGHT